jgi:hypothetical protein
MDEKPFENPLYRNAQSILRAYGEKLLSAGYSILRADDEKTELLRWFLSKYKLTEGEVGTPYELDGYYLIEGGCVTEQMYTQMIRELEEKVHRREKELIREELGKGVKAKKLNISPNEREELRESVVRWIRSYTGKGKGSQEQAFWELARVSKKVLGYKLTKGQVEGLFRRWQKRYDY